MTAPVSWLDIPQVQSALDYALGKFADWQMVPERVDRAQDEVRRLAAAAVSRGDAGTVAQLAVLKQSLDGISREFQQASPLVARVISAARAAQAGSTLDSGTVVDAAKLVTTMTANLSALSANERAVRGFGGNLEVGTGGGLMLPAWLKWGLIGLGVYWLVRRMR
jgi:hypothetical protein